MGQCFYEMPVRIYWKLKNLNATFEILRGFMNEFSANKYLLGLVEQNVFIINVLTCSDNP